MEHEFIISTSLSENGIIIKANKAGLESLAIQLLTLSSDDYEKGTHFLYDEINSLEGDSVEVVIEKI